MNAELDLLADDQYWLLEWFSRKSGWTAIDGPRTRHLLTLGLLDVDERIPFSAFRINERGMTALRRFRRRIAATRRDLDDGFAWAQQHAGIPPE